VSREVIAKLPVSLQRLMLRSWRCPYMSHDSPPRDLSALTAVTELGTGWQYPSKRPNVKYPPNVEYLHDHSYSTADDNLRQPLTALKRLGGWVEPDLAVQLGSTAPRLTHLAVQIDCSRDAGDQGAAVAAVFMPAADADGDAVIDIRPVIDRLCEAGVAEIVREVWLYRTSYSYGLFDSALAEQLCRLPNLCSLRVQIKVECEGFAALAGLSGLSKLELARCDIFKSSLPSLPAALAVLPSLHSLQLPEVLKTVRSKNRRAFLGELLQITQLRKLELSDGHQMAEKKKVAAMLSAAPHITEVAWCHHYYEARRHE